MDKPKNYESFYLEYFNSSMTVSWMAERHGLSEETALRMIEMGKRINHKRSLKNDNTN